MNTKRSVSSNGTVARLHGHRYQRRNQIFQSFFDFSTGTCVCSKQCSYLPFWPDLEKVLPDPALQLGNLFRSVLRGRLLQQSSTSGSSLHPRSSLGTFGPGLGGGTGRFLGGCGFAALGENVNYLENAMLGCNRQEETNVPRGSHAEFHDYL